MAPKNEVRNLDRQRTMLNHPTQIVAALPNQKPVQPPPKPGEFVQYLEKSGWRRIGEDESGNGIWTDPIATDTKPYYEEKILEPIKKDGVRELLRQLVVPPSSWNYPTVQAVSIQRQRDLASGGLETMIEAKKKELASMEAKLAEIKKKAEEQAKETKSPAPNIFQQRQAQAQQPASTQ